MTGTPVTSVACRSGSAILACGATICVLALSGCAGSSSVSSVVDPVAEAAQLSELAPGFKTSMVAELIPPNSSQTVTASGTGVFDRHSDRVAVSFQVSAEGHTSTAQEQYSRRALYMRLPSAHGSSLTHGKPWIKLDLHNAEAALGINSSTLSNSGASSNPSQFLSYLRASGARATRVGTEQVRAVPTTHYRATINYELYASMMPPAKRAAARASVNVLEQMIGSHSQSVDVWVDAHHRIRREEFAYHECLPGTSGMTTVHTKIEFFDFGVHAIPALPPSSEVADVTNYVTEKLKHVKLGCQQ